MARPPIWNFHDARLSLVQSCLRELIGRSTNTGIGPSRDTSGPRPLIGNPAQVVPGLGLLASHPVMEAVGSVLNQIDRGTLTDAGSARAAYQAERVSRSGFASQAGVGPSTVGLAPDCIDLLAHYLLAWVLKDQAQMNEVAGEVTDSQCDPGWLTAVVAWVGYYWNGQPPQYVPPSPDTVPFPLPPPSSPGQPLRVGVLGDWGTGQDDALAVLDQLMQQKPDLIIHVGDIYYAGTYDECQTHFLEPIKAAREKYGRYIPVYNLPGNHDYYSGGRAFYTILPQLNLGIPHAGIQQHSFFCLQNESWQLEGMDTGYNDHDLLQVADDITHLEPVEATWHQQQLSSAGSRQVILFSHHQLFSAFATIGATGPRVRNTKTRFSPKTCKTGGRPGRPGSSPGSGAMNICWKSMPFRERQGCSCPCSVVAWATALSRSSTTSPSTRRSPHPKSLWNRPRHSQTATSRRAMMGKFTQTDMLS